jgi:tight adherence protein B
MESYGVFAFLIFLLSACSMQCLLLAALYPRVAAGSPFNRRIEIISGKAVASTTDKAPRKRSTEATLREAEEKLKATTTKPSLLVRLRQAELQWSKTTYYLVCGVVGLVVFFLVRVAIGLGGAPAIGFGLSAGLLLPHWYVNFKRNRRFKNFLLQFANAVDVIVRGTKVGMPLKDCFQTIATEAQSPVKEEFNLIMDDQIMGMPLSDAVERMPERMPLTEARFFAIVIAIQSRTGGNVAEALGNLSTVLRGRQKMQQKIKALSSESKASAIIIGLLPVFVAAALYVMAPKYVSQLFSTPAGNLILAGCGVWMLIGILVMRKIIRIDV